MQKKGPLIQSCFIASFTYYDGAAAFGWLQIGTKVTLQCEPENRYDEYAVAVYYGESKLGYLPGNKNKIIALLLQNEYDIFKCIVQQMQPEEHPEQQVRIGVFIKNNV